ncbi:MAG TPA: MOSC domain-containing protein [Acidimicrobiales bacterium]|nr:MOSC domain-containing protein [Acidimicrobiales bacterium]
MAHVVSVNVGAPREIGAKGGLTGIDKRPSTTPVEVMPPGPSQSGLAGDAICDTDNHGGPDQAVYAYAREDLDWWEHELGMALAGGTFGENLTTVDLDVTGAIVGERWRIGREVVLEVTVPRIPCGTFRTWMGRPGWVKAFTRRAAPGAYLRVLAPGPIAAGDAIEVDFRPAHDVTIGMVFRALTLERDLLPRLLDAGDHLVDDARQRALSGRQFSLGF